MKNPLSGWRLALYAGLLVILAGCGDYTPTCGLPPSTDTVSVISEDWHSDLVIPVEELSPDLQAVASQFPGAKTLLFGYGKKDFIMAPQGSISKYFTGLVPGEAAIEVTGINADPSYIYPPDEMVTLVLPQGGANKLSAYIENDLVKDSGGTPLVVAHWEDPTILVYAAKSEYTFMHTCNGWAATALAQAGVTLSPSRVITSGRLMDRARAAPSVCENQ